MLLDVLCSIALYCQRCGQIHVQDVPYFTGQGGVLLRCGNCGHVQGEAELRLRQGLALSVPCGVCGTANRMVYPVPWLRKLPFEKIYCREDRFELGYIGKWQHIAEFLDFNAAEFDALHPSDDGNFMGRQQVLLEAVNRVHDMVERGVVYCRCGSREFTASVVDSSITLECARCGGYALIPAQDPGDLRRLDGGPDLAFLQPERMGAKDFLQKFSKSALQAGADVLK